MKYTVVIREAVAQDKKQVLEQLLQDKFGLNAEQAQRLGSRRSGRLMKPTGRARAELLMSMFQQVGASVALEEVREETDILSEPFQGVAPSRPVAAPTAPDDAPLAPLQTQTTASQDMADLRASAIWPAVPFGESGPDQNPFGGAADPFAAPATPGGGLDAGLASALGGLDSAPAGWGAGAGTAVMDPVVAPVVSAPAAPEPSADVWSDFTGALTLHDATPAAAPAQAAEVPQAMDTMVVTPLVDEAPKATKRRTSLGQRMAVGALVPLGISSALTLGVLALTLPPLQQGLVQRNAQAVAVAVSSNIDPNRGFQQIQPQLDALVNNSSVGFVQVELRDGSRYFASQNSEINDLLNAEVSNWLIENPNKNNYLATISPAKVYQARANEMKEMGGTANDVQKLQALADDPKNQKATNVNFIVQQVTVSQENGKRTLASGRSVEGNDNLLYTVAVGVSNAQQAASLRNTLLLVLFVSLLALGLAAYLALRAARRVVEPIEQLVKIADSISMGDLSRPVQAERNDEIGDLAQALERMRLSLDSAMERLRRRRRG
ncbi:HAMP domain-containing protein [Deinococcus multiflagellatus]|uniref:HAMP domain-containing protein n=1 Tax=Deinococcus multiflagellatus TaxID=1656887 RepID=A0ABW1ZHE0_9DEIO|nr:HAMP domain-containing protein [Deinococcus multiflagellatus]MBZ9711848.1 HAMP domain-containing protein [Deinococcus multiflagellatus]